MMNKTISETGTDVSAISSSQMRGRICIVTGELAGPDFNGGIGTTNRALALALRAQGFEIDILYTRVDAEQPFSARGTFAQHVAAFRKLGIGLACIDNAGNWNDWQAKSYLSMQHLLRHRYDLAFFDDTHGNAYYSLLAHRTGNAQLRATTICVTAHSATQWIFDLNETPVATFEDLRVMEMERRSIELADVVKAPSAYILQKYRGYGWKVPDNSIVLPNFIPAERTPPRKTKRIAVSEIVFFGRLETRKGLWMFCRALDRLKYRIAAKVVTFLGKFTTEDGISTGETLLTQSAGWPFKIRMLNDFDQEQALDYLKGHGRLALLPSPEDNSPSVLLECLTEGIPFLACSGSGGEELLDAQTRAANLFEPSVDGLCAKLLDAVEHGAQTGKPSFSAAQLQEEFSNWIGGVLASKAKLSPPAPKASASAKPVLIVLIPAEVNSRLAVLELLRTLEAYEGHVEIEALAVNQAEVQKHLATLADSLPINVSAAFEFGKIARSLAYREPTTLAICHITQLLPPSWIDRARNCFALAPDISAVTGMVAVRNEARARIREPYFSASDTAPKVRRYLLGNTRALLPLVQETNSGFVLMRSELIAKLGNSSPFDDQYDRLKRMEDWIHEMLLAAVAAGASFELVPDQVIEQPVRELPFEVFGLTQLMRSTAQSMFGFAAGSDQAILTRLAIDSGLERERGRSNADYLNYISEKTGHETIHWQPEEQTKQLAMLAHANGQIELAVDLAAVAATQEKISGASSLADFVKWEADTVNLIAEIAANKHKMLNLDHDYSFLVERDKREIVLHANSIDKGMATLLFPSVELGKINRFTCAISAPANANPIRFRIELISSSKASRWSVEMVVRGGDTTPWEFECPANLRTTCRVLIGVEMADSDDSSHNAFARWIGPRFVRRP